MCTEHCLQYMLLSVGFCQCLYPCGRLSAAAQSGNCMQPGNRLGVERAHSENRTIPGTKFRPPRRRTFVVIFTLCRLQSQKSVRHSWQIHEPRKPMFQAVFELVFLVTHPERPDEARNCAVHIVQSHMGDKHMSLASLHSKQSCFC